MLLSLPIIQPEPVAPPAPARARKPDWLRVKLPIGPDYAAVRKLVDEHKLHTICESGNCPNMGECWGAGTATFMILGNVCTRSCSFCAVATGRPSELDLDEPRRVAEAISLMKVKHAVITSVNRDELKDRGASVWRDTVVFTKELSPETTIETLIPDVKANWAALEVMISGGQEVISHNMETVGSLYRLVRPQAKYDRSLEQIRRTKLAGCVHAAAHFYAAFGHVGATLGVAARQPKAGARLQHHVQVEERRVRFYLVFQAESVARNQPHPHAVVGENG